MLCCVHNVNLYYSMKYMHIQSLTFECVMYVHPANAADLLNSINFSLFDCWLLISAVLWPYYIIIVENVWGKCMKKWQRCKRKGEENPFNCILLFGFTLIRNSSIDKLTLADPFIIIIFILLELYVSILKCFSHCVLCCRKVKWKYIKKVRRKKIHKRKNVENSLYTQHQNLKSKFGKYEKKSNRKSTSHASEAIQRAIRERMKIVEMLFVRWVFFFRREFFRFPLFFNGKWKLNIFLPENKICKWFWYLRFYLFSCCVFLLLHPCCIHLREKRIISQGYGGWNGEWECWNGMWPKLLAQTKKRWKYEDGLCCW